MPPTALSHPARGQGRPECPPSSAPERRPRPGLPERQAGGSTHLWEQSCRQRCFRAVLAFGVCKALYMPGLEPPESQGPGRGVLPEQEVFAGAEGGASRHQPSWALQPGEHPPPTSGASGVGLVPPVGSTRCTSPRRPSGLVWFRNHFKERKVFQGFCFSYLHLLSDSESPESRPQTAGEGPQADPSLWLAVTKMPNGAAGWGLRTPPPGLQVPPSPQGVSTSLQ